MKKIFAFAVGLVISMTSSAQPESEDQTAGVETTMYGDILSNYIWRGLYQGDVSLQPTLGISYKGLSLSANGNVGLSNPNDKLELDVTLSYSIGNMNIGITDYWTEDGLDPRGRYFKYDAHGTNHIFEANIGYDFGLASLQWYTNFAGNDGVNNDGKRAYSSYVEANVPFKLASLDWTATAGAVPFATDFNETTGFAVTNLSLRADKEIKVTDSFSIPLFAQLATNPCSQKAYLVLGITLQP